AAFGQLFAKRLAGTARPNVARFERRTGRMIVNQLLQLKNQLGLSHASFFTAPLFFGRDPGPHPEEAAANPPSRVGSSPDHTRTARPHTLRLHDPVCQLRPPHNAVDPSPTTTRRSSPSELPPDTRNQPSSKLRKEYPTQSITT